MNTKTIARMGPKGTGCLHMMTVVLMALLMAITGGVTAHLDTVNSVSTPDQQMTDKPVDYSTSSGYERRNSRKNQENSVKKQARRRSNGKFQQARASRNKPSAEKKSWRQRYNTLASKLRRQRSQSLGIPAPSEHTESLARFARDGNLLRWVKTVQVQIEHKLSPAYQIDYICHAVLEYINGRNDIRDAPDIKVLDFMHALWHNYGEAEVKEVPWTTHQHTYLGKEWKNLKTHLAQDSQLDGWKAFNEEQNLSIESDLDLVKDWFWTAWETGLSGICKDDNGLWTLSCASPNDLAKMEKAGQDADVLSNLPIWDQGSDAQMALTNIQGAHHKYVEAKSEAANKVAKLSSKNLDEETRQMFRDELELNVNLHREQRNKHLGELLTSLRTVLDSGRTTRSKWVTEQKANITEEIQQKYTPKSYTLTLGKVVWNFHEGFQHYFWGTPLLVKPVTVSPSGKPIQWNVPIDENGHARVLSNDGYLYTEDNPNQRVQRSKPGKAKTDVDVHLRKHNGFLNEFKILSKTKEGKEKWSGSRISHYVQTNNRKRAVPSHFTGLLGFMGPSNGAFVKLGKDGKDGKHHIKGDSVGYSFLRFKDIPSNLRPAYAQMGKELNNKHSVVFKKLAGWWMESTGNPHDEPSVPKKTGPQTKKVKPQSKKGRNRQVPQEKRDNSLNVPDEQVPEHLRRQYASKPTTHIPNQGVFVEDADPEPRPVKPAKGKTIPALRKATIDTDLKPSNHSREDLGKMTVPQLKELLKAAGQPVSGKKADLIERLVA